MEEFIAKSSLYCLPYGATFHKNNCNSWLDVTLFDSKSKLVSFEKSDAPFINGHGYLLCTYLLNNPNRVTKITTFRNLKICDHLALSNTLMNALKVDNASVEDTYPNKLLSIFLTQVLSSLDLYAPILTKQTMRRRNLWFTTELKLKCKERVRIYKRARRN